jgi:hypothetical protein
MALEHESQLYRSKVVELLGPDDVNEGKFVVIRGDEVDGPFDLWEDALKAGYGRHGLTPFLVQKIERHPTVIFMRDFDVGKLRPIDGPPTAPGLYWVQTAGGTDFELAEVFRRGSRPDGSLRACLLSDSDESFPVDWVTAYLPISYSPPPG